MGELDAELERMRRDARGRLDEQARLEARLDELTRPGPAAPLTRKDEEREEGGTGAGALEAVDAKLAVARAALGVRRATRNFSLPAKAALLFGALLVVGTILQKILMPIIAVGFVVSVAVVVVQALLKLRSRDEPDAD